MCKRLCMLRVAEPSESPSYSTESRFVRTVQTLRNGLEQSSGQIKTRQSQKYRNLTGRRIKVASQDQESGSSLLRVRISNRLDISSWGQRG